jgi:hypothetical protein
VFACVNAHLEAVSRYHNNEKILTTQRVVLVDLNGKTLKKLPKKMEKLTSRRVVQVDLSGKTFRPSREAMAIKMVGKSQRFFFKKNPVS